MTTPLAICFTKLDLMLVQPYYRPGGFVDEFFDDLLRIDPTGEAIGQDVWNARSKAAERLLQMIWPGWDMLRSVRTLFGPCYMLFPLTPIGINDLGKANPRDFENRVFEPYRLLEPLLWLLHMNGHPVLPNPGTARHA
jgi:hypothetical protein